MIYLLWSVMNFIVIFYFLYLLIGFISRGKKIFNHRFKIFSIAILLIGFTQIFIVDHPDDESNRISFSESSNECNYSKMKYWELERNLSFRVYMSVIYGNDGEKFIPIEIYSDLNGFVTGFKWQVKSAAINRNHLNGPIEYNICGDLNWNFFGISIYNQAKTFEGTIE